MKVFYQADLDKRTFEGRTKTALALRNFLSQKEVEFVDSPEKADLIHFHSSGVMDSFKAAKLKKFGKPIIYSLYSICKTEPLAHFSNHFRQKYYFGKRKTGFLLSYSAVLPLKLRAFNFKKFAKVVVPVNYLLEKLYKNTILIRIGIDTDYYRPLKNIKNESNDQKKVQESGEKKIKVGFFGHPSVYKGMVDFLDASKYFGKKFETHVFPSRQNKKITKSIRKINPQIKIHGFVDDIVKEYNGMDIIVAPHRSKLGSIANPKVLIEGMSCGKAVITTDFKFIREIVQDGAFMVKSKSPRQIAKMVRKLEDENLRIKMGKRAREIIVENFNQQKTFQQYFNLYNQLLKNNC